jgi:hypothetical protein
MLNQNELNEIGAKAGYDARACGYDPVWVNAPDLLKNLFRTDAKSTITAVESLIRADERERVLEALVVELGGVGELPIADGEGEKENNDAKI